MSCDTTAIPARIEAIRGAHTIALGGRRPVRFDPATECRFNGPSRSRRALDEPSLRCEPALVRLLAHFERLNVEP